MNRMFARRTGLSRFVRVSESKIRIQANHTFFWFVFVFYVLRIFDLLEWQKRFIAVKLRWPNGKKEKSPMLLNFFPRIVQEKTMNEFSSHYIRPYLHLYASNQAVHAYTYPTDHYIIPKTTCNHSTSCVASFDRDALG